MSDEVIEIKRGPGRPAHRPTEQSKHEVRTMAGLGISQENIAKVIGIGVTTLRQHYSLELDVGPVEANRQVAHALHNKAVKGNVQAMIFWLKNRDKLTWCDKAEVVTTTTTQEADEQRQSLIRRAANLLGPVGEVPKEPKPQGSK